MIHIVVGFRMFQGGVLIIIYFIDITLSTVWIRSSGIGTNNPSDIINTQEVRSKIECSILCTTRHDCLSFQYNQTIKYCVMLSVSGKTGPLISNEKSMHYAKQANTDCADEYDLLPVSKVCVKPFPDTKTWNESLEACQRNGGDLPVLNTDSLYEEFLDYMDKIAKSVERVAVYGFIKNNVPYWSNGDVVDGYKFCENTPDNGNQPNLCLFLTHSSESWCKSNVNRLDDALCDSTQASRICMRRSN